MYSSTSRNLVPAAQPMSRTILSRNHQIFRVTTFAHLRHSSNLLCRNRLEQVGDRTGDTVEFHDSAAETRAASQHSLRAGQEKGHPFSRLGCPHIVGTETDARMGSKANNRKSPLSTAWTAQPALSFSSCYQAAFSRTWTEPYTETDRWDITRQPFNAPCLLISFGQQSRFHNTSSRACRMRSDACCFGKLPDLCPISYIYWSLYCRLSSQRPSTAACYQEAP